MNRKPTDTRSQVSCRFHRSRNNSRLLLSTQDSALSTSFPSRLSTLQVRIPPL